MQIQARQTLASLLLPLQTSVTVISRHNPKAQAKHDGQEFKLWECMRVYAKFYFWSLGQTGATVQRVIKIAIGEFQAKWEWVSTLGSSCPLPLPTPPILLGPGLIVGRLHSISELDWTVSASLKNVLHSTSIVKQSKGRIHVTSTTEHIWPFANIWKTGYNKFEDKSCDNLGVRNKKNK